MRLAVYHPHHCYRVIPDALTAAAALSLQAGERILMLGVYGGTALRGMRWPRRNRRGGYRCPAGQGSRTIQRGLKEVGASLVYQDADKAITQLNSRLMSL